MKADLHPDYHKITVVMTDGTRYETRSCWGKEGDVLQLDVDPKTHPAWVGGVNLRKTGQMEKFNNKFAFLDKSGAAPKKDAQPQADAKAPKDAAAKDAEPKQAKTAKAEPKAAKKASDKPASEPKAEKKPQAEQKDADTQSDA